MSVDVATPVSGAPASAAPAPQTKQDLLRLIQGAATGDRQQIERLLAPFMTPGERLIWAGVSGKMGLLTTYDFAFLTDRRVGDLEVTPLTGNLSVEVCYLKDIDAMKISQPAIAITMWTWIAAGYPLWIFLGTTISLFTVGFATDFRGQISFYVFVFGAFMLSVLMIVAWTIFGIDMMRRWTLRHRKSGIWLKLRGSGIGSLIFADRDKFAMLTSLVRMITEQKRLLDKS